jgi:iron complex transport system substrate-binding protein
MKQIGFLIIASIILASCGRFNNRESNEKKDQRIVCVSKHLTEMMFALGKGHNIVACDLSSTYPDSAKLLPTVGYHRMLSAEGIISKMPDLVMHSNDIGPENVIPQLQKAGLNVKAYGGAGTIDSAKLLLKQLGDEFGESAKAEAINKSLDADMQQVANAQTAMALKDTPNVMIIHFGRANNIYFVMSGRNGAGDKMIRYAGGKTAKYEAKGAREISAEAVATANPDVILATDYGYDRMGSVEKFKTVPGVGLTNAAKNNRIYRFEEHDLIYFGPRSGQNILKLMKLIHPEMN